ncbi:hypothetical protein JX265_014057 [Neoarthrinium moseri]|uniref:Uncharacterized protein n=1 Tax=Neoarthrinium moseri TaxID=1658444 RepID=A0A9Q0AH39_9PEZI|nr:hypothetical protein JX265_014057 [Neoarthrinium moseri]
MIAPIVLTLAEAGMNLLEPILAGRFFQSVADGSSAGEMSAIWRPMMTYVITYIVNSSVMTASLRKYLWLPVDIWRKYTMNHGIHDHIMNLPVAYHVSVDATDTTKAVDLGTKASRMLEIALFEVLPKVLTLFGATPILLTTYPPFVALIQFCVVVLSAIITKRKISIVNPRRDENIKSSQDLERIRQNGLRGWASAARHFRVRDEVTVYGDQLRSVSKGSAHRTIRLQPSSHDLSHLCSCRFRHAEP